MLETIMTWILTNGMRFAIKLAVALLILLASRILIDQLKVILKKALSKDKKLNPLLRTFLLNITGTGLWVLAWVVALSHVGLAVGPLIAGFGVVGFIVGFAFQDALSNFAAGLMILANNPFQDGDFVEVGGHMGTVKELSIMATTLATPDNRRITLPNKLVWGAPLVNFTVTGTRRVEMTVGVAYGSNIAKTREVIMGVVTSDERVMADPAPVVEVNTMGDSAVVFVVRPWTKTADYWAVYFSLNQRIKEALDANKIEIPFPQRVVYTVKK